jgi:uncharacterized protein (DUF1697 family)
VPAFIALLRGVNVGKGKRVPMAQLKAMLGKLGYSGISTLLNSGNAVFISAGKSASSHATSIRNMIAGELAIEVPVIVMSSRKLNAIIEENTLAVPGVDPSRLLVICAQTADALASVAMVEKLVTRPERFLLGKHAAYLLCANGILESDAASALLGRKGQSITTRNWATILKLRELAKATGASSR